MTTLKKEIIVAALAATNSDILGDNKIIVSTAAGIFIGDLISEECTPVDSNSVSSHALVKVFNDISCEYKEKHSLDNSDGYFCLENVQLLNGSNRTSFPFVVLFFDQVIGISIGNI